jgi:hypothetical protein
MHSSCRTPAIGQSLITRSSACTTERRFSLQTTRWERADHPDLRAAANHAGRQGSAPYRRQCAPRPGRSPITQWVRRAQAFAAPYRIVCLGRCRSRCGSPRPPRPLRWLRRGTPNGRRLPRAVRRQHGRPATVTKSPALPLHLISARFCEADGSGADVEHPVMAGRVPPTPPEAAGGAIGRYAGASEPALAVAPARRGGRRMRWSGAGMGLVGASSRRTWRPPAAGAHHLPFRRPGPAAAIVTGCSAPAGRSHTAARSGHCAVPAGIGQLLCVPEQGGRTRAWAVIRPGCWGPRGSNQAEDWR